VQVTPRVPSGRTIQSCVLEGNVEAGIGIYSSDVTVQSTLIRGTTANAQDQFGDGILVLPDIDGGPSQVTLMGNRIEASARAGLSNFGSTITFVSNALVCSAFDIEGEEHMGAAFSFDNQGGNVCGCPEANGKCKVLSAGLAPPKPLDPPPPPP